MATHLWEQKSVRNQTKQWLIEAKELAMAARGFDEELGAVAAVWAAEQMHQGNGVPSVQHKIATVQLSTLQRHMDFAPHFARLVKGGVK